MEIESHLQTISFFHSNFFKEGNFVFGVLAVSNVLNREIFNGGRMKEMSYFTDNYEIIEIL